MAHGCVDSQSASCGADPRFLHQKTLNPSRGQWRRLVETIILRSELVGWREKSAPFQTTGGRVGKRKNRTSRRRFGNAWQHAGKKTKIKKVKRLLSHQPPPRGRNSLKMKQRGCLGRCGSAHAHGIVVCLLDSTTIPLKSPILHRAVAFLLPILKLSWQVGGYNLSPKWCACQFLDLMLFSLLREFFVCLFVCWSRSGIHLLGVRKSDLDQIHNFLKYRFPGLMRISLPPALLIQLTIKKKTCSTSSNLYSSWQLLRASP